MELSRKAVVGLFVALGFKSASKWNNEKLATKVSRMPTIITEDTDVSGLSEEQSSLLDEILTGLEAGKTPKIKGKDGAETPKAEPEVTDTDVEAEAAAEDTGDSETEAKKTKKEKTKAAPKTAKTPKVKSRTTRHAAMTVLILRSKKKTFTKSELVTEGNAAYVKAGGTDNEKETKTFTLPQVLNVLQAAELVTVEGDTVKRVS